MAKCYNSFYATKSIVIHPHPQSLVWQHSSLLEGDLECLQQLLSQDKGWKHYINIVGSEYPLLTNHQLIQHIKQVRWSLR